VILVLLDANVKTRNLMQDMPFIVNRDDLMRASPSATYARNTLESQLSSFSPGLRRLHLMP
jgi:hypothetical protein